MIISRAFHPRNGLPIDAFDGGSDFLPMDFGMSDVARGIQVYLLPPDQGISPWKVAAMATLLISGVFTALFILYCCLVRCCRSSKCMNDVEIMATENGEAPSDACAPSEQPPLGAADKQCDVPASFLDSPTLNVSQPFQPEPEDMAKMQEDMLAKLDMTNNDWDMGHGDSDKKPLY